MLRRFAACVNDNLWGSVQIGRRMSRWNALAQRAVPEINGWGGALS